MVLLRSCNIGALKKSLHTGPKFLWAGLSTDRNTFVSGTFK